MFYRACNAYNDGAKMRPYRQVSGSTGYYSRDNIRTELYAKADDESIYLDRDLLQLIIQERLEDINREKVILCFLYDNRVLNTPVAINSILSTEQMITVGIVLEMSKKR